MGLVQITERKGWIKRVPDGEIPVVELHLEDHEQIIEFELRENLFPARGRKTVDWHWRAVIAVRL